MMRDLVKSNGLVRPCCMPSNCVPVRDPRRPHLEITQCKTCGAKHYSMHAEPGKLLARM